MTHRRCRECGAGNVLVLTGVMATALALLVVLTLAGVVATRHRASAAADLAAVAAAETLRVRSADPCVVADRVSRANGVALSGCVVDGAAVEVTAVATAAGPLNLVLDAERRARAVIEPAAHRGGGRQTDIPDGAVGDRVVPVDGGYLLTARFGDRGPWWESGRHTGLDFAAPTGTPVVSAAAGVVAEAGPAGAYGMLVIVDHGDGASTYYAHLSAVYVGPGEAVGPGQVLGAVGATGNATGPHLHFEVRVGGVPRDPEPWLRGL